MAFDKEAFLRCLEEDEAFRDRLALLLMRAPVLAELRALREDFNKLAAQVAEHTRAIHELREDFKALSAQVAENIKAIRELRDDFKALSAQVAENTKAIRNLQEQVSKNTEAILALQEQVAKNTEAIRALQEQVSKNTEAIIALQEQVIELRKDFHAEMAALREDFNKALVAFRKELRGFVSAIGARWGLRAEEVFREAMFEFLKEYDVHVEGHLKIRDEWGIVHKDVVGREYEFDICMRDGRTRIVEVKMHVRWDDVLITARKAELFERRTGIKPEVIMVAPLIDEEAKGEALRRGFKVITYGGEEEASP